jgi:type II secretory pathway component PulC
MKTIDSLTAFCILIFISLVSGAAALDCSLPIQLNESQVVPIVRGDKIVGFTVFHLIPNGLLEKIGIKVQDEIVAIDGKPLKSSIIELYETKRARKKKSVTVIRAGQQILIEYICGI